MKRKQRRLWKSMLDEERARTKPRKFSVQELEFTLAQLIAMFRREEIVPLADRIAKLENRKGRSKLRVVK